MGEAGARVTGARHAALERLAALAALVDPACYDWDPIEVYERMAAGDQIACVPLAYGYVSYSRRDAPGKRLSFHDIAETRTGAGVAEAATFVTFMIGGQAFGVPRV